MTWCASLVVNIECAYLSKFIDLAHRLIKKLIPYEKCVSISVYLIRMSIQYCSVTNTLHSYFVSTSQKKKNLRGIGKTTVNKTPMLYYESLFVGWVILYTKNLRVGSQIACKRNLREIEGFGLERRYAQDFILDHA